MLKMTTQQIAELVGGQLKGAGDVVVSGVRSIESAEGCDLTFVAKKELCKKAAGTKAGALITAWPVEGCKAVQIVCKDPELAIVKVLGKFYEDMFPAPAGISETAVISPRAKLGKGVAVGHCAVIEDDAELGDDVAVHALAYVGRGARIGARTVIHPHVTVYDRAEIGSDCIIHANCVIGDEGFGYVQREGRSIRFPHIARVRIGNNVEVLGLSSVDRGMIEDTVVGDGAKIDKHCHVAHNCRVGENSILAGSTTLGGSVTLGKGVVIGGAAAVADHVSMGDGATLAAGTGLMSHVKAGETYWGLPARPIKDQMRIEALLNKLPEMRKKIVELEKTVEALTKRLGETK